MNVRSILTSLARFLLVAVLLAFGVRFAAVRWDAEQRPEIYTAELSSPSDGRRTLSLTGLGLFRVNTLRVDGRPVRVLHHEAQGYGACFLDVDASLFQPGESYRIRVGKSYPVTLGELYHSNDLTFTAN